MIMYYFVCLLALGSLILVTARPRRYRQINTSACPERNLLRSPGTITSPNHPGLYPPNLSCTWIIMAPKDSLVSLEFKTFDIKSGPTCGKKKCRCDFLQVRKTIKTSPTYVKNFCEGNRPTGVVNTLTHRVRIHFKTDGTVQGKGFSLSYKFIKKTTSTPSVSSTTTDEISTPVVVNTQPLTQKPTSSSTSKLNVLPSVTADRKSSSPEISTNADKMTTARRAKNQGTPSPDGTKHSTPRPSSESTPIDLPQRARSAPLQGQPVQFPHVHPNVSEALYLENKEKMKQKDEEEGVSDIVVLGPAIPIILIFLGVVAAIAWWNFRADRKERIRYEEITSRRRPVYKKKKRKESLREIRTKKLYSEMARNWRDQSQHVPTANTRERPQRKRSFAGRLLELAEKPKALITPRSSRPQSMVAQDQGIQLVVMRDKKKGSRPSFSRDPGASTSLLEPSSSGHLPPSRPASLLLRDALNMIFSGTSSQSTEDRRGDSPMDAGSTSDSKRASLKRVSFYDEIAEQKAEEKAEEEATVSTPKPKPEPLSIPSILIRQPSCEETGGDRNKRLPIPPPTRKPESPHKDERSIQDLEEVPSIEVSQEETVPFLVEDIDRLEGGDHRGLPPEGPSTDSPSSFERKLVGMLEKLQQDEEEMREGEDEMGEDEERADETQPLRGGHQVSPVPQQDSDSPERTGTDPPAGRLNFPDLEEFLLNLDRELEDASEPPYSWVRKPVGAPPPSPRY